MFTPNENRNRMKCIKSFNRKVTVESAKHFTSIWFECCAKACQKMPTIPCFLTFFIYTSEKNIIFSKSKCIKWWEKESVFYRSVDSRGPENDSIHSKFVERKRSEARTTISMCIWQISVDLWHGATIILMFCFDSIIFYIFCDIVLGLFLLHS